MAVAIASSYHLNSAVFLNLPVDFDSKWLFFVISVVCNYYSTQLKQNNNPPRPIRQHKLTKTENNIN